MTPVLSLPGPGSGALTRRRFLGGLGTSAALGAIAACGGGHGTADGRSGASASATAAGPWSFTDDLGKKVTASHRPRRIATLTDTASAALWAAGLRPVAAFDSGQGITEAVGLDLKKTHGIIGIGSKAGELDTEALVSAAPDLLVDAVQADGTLQTVGSNARIKGLAPVVGIDMYKPVEHIVGTADRLTSSLGTHLADASAKRVYDRAADRLGKAAAANPELRVGFVFDISGSELGVMNARTWAVLQTVHGLGLNLVDVGSAKDDTYSHAVSWENATGIPADLLVWAVADPLPTNPVWKRVPAVEAGQLWKPDVASWYAYSYGNFSALLSGLADRVSAARAGVGAKGSLA
jgi:iron complex transport system substrate-binding protein